MNSGEPTPNPHAGAGAVLPSPARGSAAWLRRYLLAALAAISAALVLGGYSYYRWEAVQIQAAKHNEIAAIAAAKTGQIIRWRKERMSDARRLSESGAFRNAVEDVVRGTDRGAARAQILDRLKLERETGEYADVMVLTPGADVLVSARAAPGPVESDVRAVVTAALASAVPVLGELHHTGAGGVRIETAAAVRDDAGHALAVVVVSNEAEDFLFPLMQEWPTNSPTAETLIVRRDGGDVLFLNDLRHRQNTALTLRMPLEGTDLPASMAASGRTGLYVGSDYRGESVLADLRAIPGTAWFMVAKVDTAEILAEVRYRALAVALGVATMILFVAAAAGYAYRTRQSDERRRAEGEIRVREALLSESQRVASLGHYVLDVATGRWTSSDALDTVFGIGPAYERDLGGWATLVHPEERDEMTAYFGSHVIAGGHPFDKEYRIVRASDGAERWVHGLGQVERDAAGTPLRMFGTIQDVTDRRTLEEGLRQRNSELARFVYTVSHDLKSPLVTIRTFLGFLEQDRKLGDETRIENDLDFIRRAADKMSALLNDLLELSRVGRKVNPPVEVPLQTVVRDALDMVAGRLAQRHVTVTVTQAPIVLRGDRARLLEVFENLIDNAAKFVGDQPDPRMEVGVEELEREIVIFVRDNGVGIDPRHKGKLFGLFEKLHPESDGTGIGLALVKRIVEVHGGRVWAESAGPGQGSTFRFTLSGTKRL